MLVYLGVQYSFLFLGICHIKIAINANARTPTIGK